MFTGIVQAVGQIVSVEPTSTGTRLAIAPGGWDHRPARGDSISVSGCCLTLANDPEPDLWRFHAVPETLAKTTLAGLRPGDRVNLEHALTPSTPLGGHFVQGHVDGVGEVQRVVRPDDGGGEWRIRVRPPDDLRGFLIPKGSVAIDGVSLTIAALAEDGSWLEVALIPETLERTTLASHEPGSRVNLEADMLVKSVVAVLRRMPALAGGHERTA